MAQHPSIKTHKALVKAHKKITSTLTKIDVLQSKAKPNYLKINELANLGMDQAQELSEAFSAHDDSTAASDSSDN